MQQHNSRWIDPEKKQIKKQNKIINHEFYYEIFGSN